MTVMRCANCNTMVVPTMTVCPVCATPLQGEAPRTTAPVPTVPPVSPASPPGAPAGPALWTPEPTPPPNPAEVPTTTSPSAGQFGVVGQAARTPVVSSGVAGAGIPPGGAMPPEAVASGSGGLSSGRSKLLIGAGAVVVVLALAIATVVVLGGRSGGKTLTVTLVSLDAAPKNPFTESVVTVSDKSAEAFGAKARSSSEPSSKLTPISLRGDASRLYGVSSTSAVCDQGRLTKLVTARGAAAQAWADAMSTSRAQIPETISHLTPVLLARDLAVTEHQLVKDQTEPTQVILQAGTAVLIDVHGAPKVRCVSGDPLSTAEVTETARLVGERWDGFNGAKVIDVEPTPAPVKTIPAVDIDTGKQIAAPLGGTLSLDGYLVSDDKGVSVESFDGKTRTVVIDHPVAKALDDGAGGIIYQELRPKSASGTMLHLGDQYDLARVAPQTSDQAAVWRLGAGQTTPTKLLSSPDPSTRWQAIAATGKLGVHRVLAYVDVPVGAVTTGDPGAVTSSLHLLDLESGKDSVVDPAVAGTDNYFLGASINHDELAWITGAGGEHWQHVDADLKPLADLCTQYSGSSSERGCHSERGGIDSSGNVVSADTDDAAGTIAAVTVAKPAGAPVVRTIEHDGVGTSSSPQHLTEFDIKGDQAMFSSMPIPPDPQASTSTVLFDLAKGTATDLRIPGVVRFLRAPILRPASPASDDNSPATSPNPTAPATTQPALTAPTWDEFKNASIPGQCTHPPTTLVDGKDPSLVNEPGKPDPGIYELLQTLNNPNASSSSPGYLQGLPSDDAGPLTVVVVSCNAGGVGWPNDIVAFRPGGTYYDEVSLMGHMSGDIGTLSYDADSLWPAAGLEGPARDGIWKITLQGDVLDVYTGASVDGDYGCCASSFAVVKISAGGGKLHIDSVTPDSGP